MKIEGTLLMTAALGLCAVQAIAKLPPLSEEAKAKAAETAARAVYGDQVGTYKLCLSQDRVANVYRAGMNAAGKAEPVVVQTPPCAEPGVFAYAPAASAPPPLEASGAHSPAKTAVGAPSSSQPDTPGKK